MTTDFPTAPSAYGLNGPSAAVTVEKSPLASHTEILTPPQFACPRNPVARAHPFGEGREGIDFPNDAPLHRFGHLRGGLEVVGEDLLEVVESILLKICQD